MHDRGPIDPAIINFVTQRADQTHRTKYEYELRDEFAKILLPMFFEELRQEWPNVARNVSGDQLEELCKNTVQKMSKRIYQLADAMMEARNINDQKVI